MRCAGEPMVGWSRDPAPITPQWHTRDKNVMLAVADVKSFGHIS
jgi:hypothetical protein